MEQQDIQNMLRELSSSSGGSLVKRIKKLHVSPSSSVLFIGLGGLGCETLNAVKKIYLDEFEESDQVRFLAIDTDSNSFEKINYDPQKTGRIATNEQFSIYEGDCATLITDPPTEVNSWFSPKVDPKVLADDGAGKVRQIGRIMLCGTNAYSNLRETITALVKEIHDPLHRVHIVLIAGISGGTGSGSFVDVSYIIREIAKDYASHSNPLYTWGVFFTPEVQYSVPDIQNNSTVWNSLQANGYAAMKELDYFISNGTQSAKATEHIYDLVAPAGVSVQSNWPIYDEGHVFIVSTGDNVTDKDSIVDNTAHALMNMFQTVDVETDKGKSSQSALSTYSNVQQDIITWLDDHVGKTIPGKPEDPQCVHDTVFPAFMNYKYSTFGYSSMYFPRDEIMAYCANVVLSKVYEKWQAADTLSQESVDAILEHFNMGTVEALVSEAESRMLFNPGDLRIDKDDAEAPDTTHYLGRFGKVRDTASTMQAAMDKAADKAKLYEPGAARLAQEIAGTLESYLETAKFLTARGPFVAIATLSGYGHGTDRIHGCIEKIAEVVSGLPTLTAAKMQAYQDAEEAMKTSAADREKDKDPTDAEMDQFLDACWAYSLAYFEYLLYANMVPTMLEELVTELKNYNNKTFAMYVPVMENLIDMLNDDATFMLQDVHIVNQNHTERYGVDALGLAASEETRKKFIKLFEGYVDDAKVDSLAADFANSMFVDEEKRKIWANLADTPEAFAPEIRDIFNKFFGSLVNDMLEKFVVLAYSKTDMKAEDLEKCWGADDGTPDAMLRDAAIAQAAKFVVSKLKQGEVLIKTQQAQIRRELITNRKVQLLKGMDKLNDEIKRQFGLGVSYGELERDNKSVIYAISFAFPLALPLITNFRNWAQVYFDSGASSAGRHLDEGKPEEGGQNWRDYLPEPFGIEADQYYVETNLPLNTISRTSTISNNDSVMYGKIREAVQKGLDEGYIIWDGNRPMLLNNIEITDKDGLFNTCVDELKLDPSVTFADCLQAAKGKFFVTVSMDSFPCRNKKLEELADKTPKDPRQFSNLCRIIRGNMTSIRKVLAAEEQAKRAGIHDALEIFREAKERVATDASNAENADTFTKRVRLFAKMMCCELVKYEENGKKKQWFYRRTNAKEFTVLCNVGLLAPGFESKLLVFFGFAKGIWTLDDEIIGDIQAYVDGKIAEGEYGNPPQYITDEIQLVMTDDMMTETLASDIEEHFKGLVDDSENQESYNIPNKCETGTIAYDNLTKFYTALKKELSKLE